MLDRVLGYRVHIVAGIIALVVVVATVGLLFPAAIGREPTTTLVAEFTETPGLYTDNAVNILGVATGKVTAIQPQVGQVRVTMEIPRSTKVPANVRAILMAPNPVSDRTIELYPPYTGGAQLPDRAVIPLGRTTVPLSVDAVFGAVDNLAKTLGPSGANANGSLSRVVSSLATLTKGNGANLQNTLAALASALPAFTANPGQISQLITNLDRLSTTLAQHNSTIDALFGDVAKATQELSDERGTLASAIANLQDGLQQVVSFLRTNRGAITGAVANLATTTGALIRDQNALSTTFNTAALGFQNFNRAVDQNAPCASGQSNGASRVCPIVYGRLDITPNSEAIVRTYCHGALQEAQPILAQSIPAVKTLGVQGTTTADTINTLCLAEYAAIQGRGGSPGAPSLPDLGVSRFLK